MKAVVAAFNQEKALVGAFSVITNLRMELFEALVPEHILVVEGAADPPVRGHRSEQPGAVQLLAVQDTPLQEVGGPGGGAGGVAGEAGGP